MNQVEVIDNVIEPHFRDVKESLQRENRELTDVLDRISGLKQAYDTIQLSKDIRNLQEASRIQNMSGEIRSLMLVELQRRKLIKQVIDGERI